MRRKFTMDFKSLFIFMSLWLIVSYILLDSVQCFEGPKTRRRRRRRKGKRSENTRDYISSDEDNALKSAFMIWVCDEISCFVLFFLFVLLVLLFGNLSRLPSKTAGLLFTGQTCKYPYLKTRSLSVRLKIYIRVGLILFPIIQTNFTSSGLKNRDLTVFGEKVKV